MAVETNEGQKAPVPLSFSGGNIVLICYGPVIISDRPAAELLAMLDAKPSGAGHASVPATGEGDDVAGVSPGGGS